MDSHFIVGKTDFNLTKTYFTKSITDFTVHINIYIYKSKQISHTKTKTFFNNFQTVYQVKKCRIALSSSWLQQLKYLRNHNVFSVFEII